MTTLATLRSRMERELREIERRRFKRRNDGTKAAQLCAAIGAIEDAITGQEGRAAA